jgi:UDP-N-acetylglucosamine 1-carboxyvinyltransferase
MKKMKMRVQGGQIPSGEIQISGAKNSATRLMAAALLTHENVVLLNFPTELVDVRHKGRFMSSIGVLVDYNCVNSSVCINASQLAVRRLDSYDYPIRTTYLLVAGQIMQDGMARIPYPGGCKLGERKYDLHILVWKKLGCVVEEEKDHIKITATSGHFIGNEIDFPISTVGGTENALLCAVLAEGVTHIRNAYITPEIENLIQLLHLMGAEIEVEGASMITVRGVSSLRGATIEVIPDRIEALTWIVYAALSGGRVVLNDVPFSLMEIPLKHLRDAGVDYFRNETSVYISPECFSNHSLQPFEIACGTHPGIISDMQSFYVLLALKAAGRSVIIDYRYPERVAFAKELSKFCRGEISWSSKEVAFIRVNGPVCLQAAEVNSTDLRGSMTQVLAALLAEGESVVHDVGMALRGYNNMEGKLKSLGITFTLENDD